LFCFLFLFLFCFAIVIPPLASMWFDNSLIGYDHDFFIKSTLDKFIPGT